MSVKVYAWLACLLGALSLGYSIRTHNRVESFWTKEVAALEIDVVTARRDGYLLGYARGVTQGYGAHSAKLPLGEFASLTAAHAAWYVDSMEIANGAPGPYEGRGE